MQALMNACCVGFAAPKKGTRICAGKFKVGDKVYPLPEVANHAANANLGLDASRAATVIGEGRLDGDVQCVKIVDKLSKVKGQPIDLWPSDVSYYPNGEAPPQGSEVCAGKYKVGDKVYAVPQVANDPGNAHLGLSATRAMTVHGEGRVRDGLLCVRLIDPLSKVGSEPIDLFPGDVSLYEGGVVPEGTPVCDGKFLVGDLVYPLPEVANDPLNAALGLDSTRPCTVLGEGDLHGGVVNVRLLDRESKMGEKPIDLWPSDVKKLPIALRT